MADFEKPRSRALFTAVLPVRRAGGLLESVKRKIVGRLLLDGGAVEEPARGRRALELPRPDPRPRSRPWR